MKKRILALMLALMMGVILLSACNSGNKGTSDSTSTPESKSDESTADSSADNTDDDTSDSEEEPAPPVDLVKGNGETIKVMVMPSGMVEDTVKQDVTDAINEVLMAELNFKVELIMSGPAWGFEDQVTAMQTGTSDIDIMPAHSWSGVPYPVGAREGQWIRLDDPNSEFGNLLELYGPDIYKEASDGLVATATVPGAEGVGIYGMLIEKDCAQQIGFLVNKDMLDKYELSLDDFKPENFADWGEKLQIIKDGEGSNFYPLNVEAEVLDRAVNHILFIEDPKSSLGIYFNNGNPAATEIDIVSRYQTDTYKNYISLMREYYQAGFIDPALGVADTASDASSEKRNNGNYFISTFSYAPGAEVTQSEQTGVNLEWVPAWSEPIGTSESFMGAGLAVYAGSKNVELSVQFLNFLNTNAEVADLLAAGIEGVNYTDNGDGSISYIDDSRGGWNIWRFGVVGDISAATPISDPNEWKNFRTFNEQAVLVSSMGFLFDRTPVENEMSACNAAIQKYAIPLGSGAADPAQLDTFLAELEAAGVATVVEEATSQYETWLAASN